MLSVLLLVHDNFQGVSGCRSRSGEDSERNKVYSHKGTEPTWDSDTPIKINEAVDDGDEDKAREDGEIKVSGIEIRGLLQLLYSRLERIGSFQLLKLK